MYASAADVYCSARKADTELSSPVNWALIGRVSGEMLGLPKERFLPTKPPSRSWYVKTRDRKVRPNLEVYRLRVMEANSEAALAMGLADPDKPYDIADSTRRPLCDGKVITPITNAPKGTTKRTKAISEETGEIVEVDRPVRYEPDAKLHITGDGRQLVGVKFWTASLRGPEPNRIADRQGAVYQLACNCGQLAPSFTSGHGPRQTTTSAAVKMSGPSRPALVSTKRSTRSAARWRAKTAASMTTFTSGGPAATRKSASSWMSSPTPLGSLLSPSTSTDPQVHVAPSYSTSPSHHRPDHPSLPDNHAAGQRAPQIPVPSNRAGRRAPVPGTP